MLAAEKACFDAEHARKYPQNFNLKNNFPSPPPPPPPPNDDLVDSAITARNKRLNRIDKYFILAVHPDKSAGYGMGHSNKCATGHPKRYSHDRDTNRPKETSSAVRIREYAKGALTGLHDQLVQQFGHHEGGLHHIDDIHNQQQHHFNDNNEQQHHFNDNNERKIKQKIEDHKPDKDPIYLGYADIVNKTKGPMKAKRIPAFQKERETSADSRQSEWLRFLPNLSKVKGVNINSEDVEEVRAVPRPDRTRPEKRAKKLIPSQVTFVDRLARSKWRRDPIHERLLYLTGHTQHKVDDLDYVKHMDNILQTKHNEKMGRRIAALAEIERDREWLWSVKYDLDFSHMEQSSLEQHRVERQEAEEAELNRQDAMFSSAGKQTFYTVATRTDGLDKMRNIKELRETHRRKNQKNIEKGIAHPRRTWLLPCLENKDRDMEDFVKAETVSELYLASEQIIRDTAPVQDQLQQEEEKLEAAVKAKKAE